MLGTIVVLLLGIFVAYKLGGVLSGPVLRFFSFGSRQQPDDDLAVNKLPDNSQQIFFNTVFSLLGRMAKSDGHISGIEIRLTEKYMAKMLLTNEQKRKAMQLFSIGANPEFNVKKSLKDFEIIIKRNPNMSEILLVYIIALGHADGLLVPPELDIVHEVADGLGFSSIAFDHLLNMISSQNKFSEREQPEQKAKTNSDKSYSGNSHTKETHTSDSHTKDTNGKNGQPLEKNLAAAYAALGVDSNTSYSDIKKAYRKLVNQYHPDKLVTQGIPDFMIKEYADRFRKIQAAYEYIKKTGYSN